MSMQAEPLSAWERSGKLLLFWIYLVLLAGRYTLDRVDSAFPALDLRWIGLVSVVMGYVIWRHSTQTSAPVVRPRGQGWFLAWCGWLALSALWGHPDARTEKYVIDVVLLAALVAVAADVAGRLPRRALHAVWTWFLVSGSVYLLAALHSGPGEQGRYSAFGGGPNVFARVMLLAALAAFFLAVVRRRHLPLLAVPPLALGAILSGSRGALVAVLLMTLVFGLPLARRLSRPAQHGAAVLGLVVVAALPFVLQGNSVGVFVRQRYLEQTLGRRYDSGRAEIATDSWQLFLESPLLGKGIDGYYASIGSYSGFVYPHNLALATLAESGLVGAILLAAAVLALSRSGARSPRSSEALFFLAGALFVAVASLFSGDYYDTRFLWLFLVLASVEGRREDARAVHPDDGVCASRGPLVPLPDPWCHVSIPGDAAVQQEA